MSESILQREELFKINEERLKELAYRAIHVLKMDPKEFVVVCIDVDDPTWTEIVDVLMPNENWQRFRDRGEIPIARGSVYKEGICGFLKEVVPDISESLSVEPPEGDVFAIIMGDGGASVYLVKPVG